MKTYRTRQLKLLSVLTALSLAFTAMPNLAAEKEQQSIRDSKQIITDSKEKIDALQEEQKKVNKKIEELEDLKADTAAYVKALDQSMTEITNELISLNDSIEKKQLDISFTEEQLLKATQTASDQYASMKLRIKFMYEKGDTSFIDMILNATSWSDLLNKAEYISRITRYDREKLEEFEETRQLVEDTGIQLQAENAQLTELKTQAQAKQDSIQALLDEKTAELKAYSKKIATAENEIEKKQDSINDLKAAIKAQEANIEAMEKEIARQEEEARKKAEKTGSEYKERTVTGGFKWPCPASSTISSSFGEREQPTEGASTYHKGIDIAAPTGSKVIAAASGKVVISTYSPSAGNYIMISHGSGTYTVYMHMSSLAVSEGDEVSQGETIGAVGSTGYSTGPHLHFGIRKNGSYVDPESYM